MLKRIFLAACVFTCCFAKLPPAESRILHTEHAKKPCTTFTISGNNLTQYPVIATFSNIGGDTYVYTVPPYTSADILGPMPAGSYTVTLQVQHPGNFYFNFNFDIHCSLPYYNSGTVSLTSNGYFLVEMPLC
jgi:hypothetical protein